MKTAKFFLPILVTIPTLIVPAACSAINKNSVCCKQQCVDVDLAQSSAEQQRGLQGRDGLGDHQGMLFIFSQPDIYKFWMKDMKFSIDILWLDYAQRVIYTKENVPPCLGDPCPSYASAQDSLYVLELPAGKVNKMGIKEGDRWEFHITMPTK